jgi:hypothetical protein
MHDSLLLPSLPPVVASQYFMGTRDRIAYKPFCQLLSCARRLRVRRLKGSVCCDFLIQ